MSKKLNETAILNELKGASLFFRRPSDDAPAAPAAGNEPGEPVQPSPPGQPAEAPRPKTPPVPEGVATATAATTPPTVDAVPATLDFGDLPYRKDSFLFTADEFDALARLKLDLQRRLDTKVTKNDLMRCALHYLVQDYQRHGETSAVLRPIKKE